MNNNVKFEQIMSYRNINGVSLRDMIYEFHCSHLPDESKADTATKEYIASIFDKFFK